MGLREEDLHVYVFFFLFYYCLLRSSENWRGQVGRQDLGKGRGDQEKLYMVTLIIIIPFFFPRDQLEDRKIINGLYGLWSIAMGPLWPDHIFLFETVVVASSKEKACLNRVILHSAGVGEKEAG